MGHQNVHIHLWWAAVVPTLRTTCQDSSPRILVLRQHDISVVLIIASRHGDVIPGRRNGKRDDVIERTIVIRNVIRQIGQMKWIFAAKVDQNWGVNHRNWMTSQESFFPLQYFFVGVGSFIVVLKSIIKWLLITLEQGFSELRIANYKIG